MPLTQIKKRDGRIVEFDSEKISKVIQKAFIAVRGGIEEEKLYGLTKKIVGDIEKFFPERIPSVENAQDLVEKTLMEEGFYDVVKSYILYRYEHAKIREEEKRDILEKIESSDLIVIKGDGTKENFAPDKLKNSVFKALAEYEKKIDLEALLLATRESMHDQISTKDIARSVVFTARSFIEQDPIWSRAAAKLLLHVIYKEVIDARPLDFSDLSRYYREAFVKNIKKGVEQGRFDRRLLGLDLERLSFALKPERDSMFQYLGLQTLYDRYFTSDLEAKKVLETPQAFWMRVAMGLALGEKEAPEEWAERFYEVTSTLRFVPSTPTLFHSGTVKPQLSSCYLNTVQDSLEDIFKTFGDNAQLSKWSGGIGTDWTNIRGTGALIKGTGVESQGVIPFLKIANDTTAAINRSGRRRGATCVYLETWHIDIEDFLELRKNTGDDHRRTHDMDTANWIPDIFMRRVLEDGDWTLLSPDEAPDLHHIFGKKFDEAYEKYEKMAREGKINLYKNIKARDLWRKMLTMLFETGHPWVTWKDPSNIRSPQDHAGVIHNSNLCTEITLNTSKEETAVCNLGSVNLSWHVIEKRLDQELIRDTVSTAMRMLDNVVDICYYPTGEAKNSNMKHRPVGLGIMGFQDALYMLDINFDSEAACDFADRSMEMVSYYAILTSAELARERGPYLTYKGSKWDRGILPQDTIELLENERGLKIDVPRTERLDWSIVREAIRRNGMRNSNCLAIAPTATISNISGTSSCIEPIYKNLYVKANQSGDFTIINPYLVEDLKKLNLWDYEMLGKIKYYDGSIAEINEIPRWLKEKYKEAFEINPRWLIKAAAYRGRWIDQSQSLNIFYRGSSGKEIADIYVYAWEMGLKTTYYLRTLGASQVEKSTLDAGKFGATHRREENFSEAMGPVMQLKHALGVAEEVPTEAPTQSPVMVQIEETQQKVQVVLAKSQDGLSAQAGPKLCRIDDPNCEACQ